MPALAFSRRCTTAALAAASVLAAGAALPATADAAEPKLTTQLVGAAELPGFEVLVKPQMTSVNDRNTGSCSLSVPKKTVAASTALDKSTTSSDKRTTTSLSVSETVIRMPSASAAKSVFAQTERKAATCLRGVGDGSGDDSTISARGGDAKPVAGSSDAFRVDVLLTGRSTEKGIRFESRQAFRQVYYLAGNSIVQITTSRSVSVVDKKSISITGSVGPVVKQLAVTAGTAAVAKLGG